jgi:hypothetical protein
MSSYPGINIQAPWSQLILSGRKTMETRFYPLPKKYIGTKLALVETPGPSKVFKARVIGLITFGESFPYKSKAAFYADSRKHLVTTEAADFSWESGLGKLKWGWPILRVEPFDTFVPVSGRRGIIFSSQIALPSPS